MPNKHQYPLKRLKSNVDTLTPLLLISPSIHPLLISPASFQQCSSLQSSQPSPASPAPPAPWPSLFKGAIAPALGLTVTEYPNGLPQELIPKKGANGKLAKRDTESAYLCTDANFQGGCVDVQGDLFRCSIILSPCSQWRPPSSFPFEAV